MAPVASADEVRTDHDLASVALFETAPIDGQAWLRILLVAAVAALVVALDKRRLRGRPL